MEDRAVCALTVVSTIPSARGVHAKAGDTARNPHHVENDWVEFRPTNSIRSPPKVGGEGSLGASPDPAPRDPPHAPREGLGAKYYFW